MPNRILRAALVHSERWNRCPVGSRDFYMRLVMLVDDYGRHEANLQLLASVAYPYGEPYGVPVTCRSIADHLLIMCEASLAIVYDGSEGKKYVQLLKWKEHARTESRCPAASEEQMISKCCAIDQQMISTPPIPPPTQSLISPFFSPNCQGVQEEDGTDVSRLEQEDSTGVLRSLSRTKPEKKEKKEKEQGRIKPHSGQGGKIVPRGVITEGESYRITQALDKAEKRLEKLMAASRKEVANGFIIDHGYDDNIKALRKIISDYNRQLGNPELPSGPDKKPRWTREEAEWLKARRQSGLEAPRTDGELRQMMAAEAHRAEHPEARIWESGDLLKDFEARMREGGSPAQQSPGALLKAPIEGGQSAPAEQPKTPGQPSS